MRFVVLRLLTHSELGMFHEYRRQKKERSKQRAINFDWDVVDRIFPAAKDCDRIDMILRYDTDDGVLHRKHWLRRQAKNWRLEGNCPRDRIYKFVEPGCLFAMEVDSGVSPAVGSWILIPKGDPLAKTILAEGESKSLVKSAMIALHGKEGERIWSALSAVRPDMFSRAKGNGMSRSKKMQSKGRGVELAPNPKRLVQILASVGHTMPSAVADLVDNSITADATDIAITFGRPNEGHGRWMSIADNGRGMGEASLVEAMRIGSDVSYESNSLGKYGYGLKGASWSQTDAFTVVTKVAGKPVHHLTWDTDDMDEWLAKSDPLEPWQQKATGLKDHGTVVLWKNMRPPQAMPVMRGLDPHSAEIMQLTRHLALVFHRFLEGKAQGRKRVSISINGRPIRPNNPVGHPLTVSYDAKTIRIPTEAEDGRVRVQTFLLPSEEEITTAASTPEDGRAQLDLIGLYGKRNETQGLFIYRNDRLIKWGGWHQMWETNDEKTKLARVCVDFDSMLDDSFKINISKQIVQLPQQLQAEIKKLAEVARKDSQKKYRKSAVAPPGKPNGGPARPSLPALGGSPLPGTPKPRTPSTPAPIITAKPVKTGKFLWKLTTSLTGAKDLQVSDLNRDLAELVKQIAKDPLAVDLLARFLAYLDQIDAQKSLLAKKGS